MGNGAPRPAWQRPDPAFWQGRRVLLTGHTGFKGSWLALWLSSWGPGSPASPWCRTLNPPCSISWGCQGRLDHHLDDLRDPAALAALVASCRPEVVLHLAAQPLVRRSYREPVGTWATNVHGTLHLLEALRSLDQPCAAVLITTDKVYRQQRMGSTDIGKTIASAATTPTAPARRPPSWPSPWRASFCGPRPPPVALSATGQRPGRQRDRRWRLGRRPDRSRRDALPARR